MVDPQQYRESSAFSGSLKNRIGKVFERFKFNGNVSMRRHLCPPPPQCIDVASCMRPVSNLQGERAPRLLILIFPDLPADPACPASLAALPVGGPDHFTPIHLHKHAESLIVPQPPLNVKPTWIGLNGPTG